MNKQDRELLEKNLRHSNFHFWFNLALTLINCWAMAIAHSGISAFIALFCLSVTLMSYFKGREIEKKLGLRE